MTLQPFTAGFKFRLSLVNRLERGEIQFAVDVHGDDTSASIITYLEPTELGTLRDYITAALEHHGHYA